MSIWAEIKKAINSDLNKPLNITLDEIKTSLKPKRVIKTTYGVPYNATYNSQVLTGSETPILSVQGTGRILQIIPVYGGSATESVQGTALVNVDGITIVNAEACYAPQSSSYPGCSLVDYSDEHSKNSVNSSMFGTLKPQYYSSPSVMLDASQFATFYAGVTSPNGIPFDNGFEIRLTQKGSQADPNKCGVIAIYELY